MPLPFNHPLTPPAPPTETASSRAEEWFLARVLPLSHATQDYPGLPRATQDYPPTQSMYPCTQLGGQSVVLLQCCRWHLGSAGHDPLTPAEEPSSPGTFPSDSVNVSPLSATVLLFRGFYFATHTKNTVRFQFIGYAIHSGACK